MTASIGITGNSGNFLSVTPGVTATVSSVTANNAIASVTNIPSGTSYRFTPPAPAPVYTYAWTSDPAGFTSTSANPTDTPSVTTTYTVVVTNATGCTNTATTTVTVQSGAAITTQPATSLTTVCQGSTTSFSVVATGPSLTYQWFQDATPVGTNAATLTLTGVTPANNGVYTVTVTPICGGTVTSDGVATLTVTPSPTVDAPSAWPSTVCSGTTTTVVPLTGSVGATFNITGGAAIGLANQTGVTEIPSFTGIVGTATISITPVAGTCTGTAISYSITIQALPTTVTISPATPTICSSDVNAILLTGAGGAIPPST